MRCRCYEVRCLTGAVVGNYSSDGSPILFDTSKALTQPGLNVATVRDSYGRTYGGNPLESEELLFTQCYNNTLVSLADRRFV